ncbi:alpha/beta fold hydrolase [Aquimarina agarilytica]|uniref:alpha/beta fold hydrolase n=1 Tax=Aquimarina agarilytica TaxID=1087449 RepID=UPI0002885673|nr:alpha/beta fold hydrolase [Aquimarina agarilytica]
MKLHSNIIGEGDPFLILHGFLGMGDNWKTLGKKYSELGYQVHMIDQRNHGRSPHSDQFSYQHLSDDLLEYCNTHQLSSIILLGHSMGGKTAMHFACEHSHLVAKLIIADIAPKYYAPHHQDILDSLLALDFSEITSRTDAETILKQYIKDTGTRLFLLKNLYRKSKTEFDLRINLKILNQKVHEIGKALDNTAFFNGETLFLSGENSNYILANDSTLIKTHFPNSQVQEISKSGHWLHAENPVDFFNYSSKFIKTP